MRSNFRIVLPPISTTDETNWILAKLAQYSHGGKVQQVDNTCLAFVSPDQWDDLLSTVQGPFDIEEVQVMLKVPEDLAENQWR